ncbi:MAG: ferredoxin reductase [Rhizobiales bacterium]|nr:ferredoxin reductase [Hyphomicrobiales bacterium]
MTQAEVLPPRLVWQEAEVRRIVQQTPTVKSFFLAPPAWHGFVAGQHIDVRLTAPDGYQAQRSYSIGSPPEAAEVELVIERLSTGEVSPFFHEVVQVGDMIEMRGPIGGHFDWQASDGGPVLLIGGGSGVVPLVSMLRHRAAAAPDVKMGLVYSARRFEDVIFRDELLARAAAEPDFALHLALTREAAPVAGHRHGRIDRAFIAEALAGLGAPPKLCFVCGATAFVEVASMFLVEIGVPFAAIRTERYGGTPAEDPIKADVAPEE